MIARPRRQDHHIGFGVFQLLLLFLLLAHFQVVQLRTQTLPGHFAVAVLAASVLALHHGVGGNVRQAHSRISFVNVLSTGTTGAVGVHAHIGWVDVDFDGIINFWVHKHRSKLGVTAAR